MPVDTGARAPRLHYAWIVAAVTFFVLLITAGIRATPGLLMVPLEEEFGWSRAVISLAVAINIDRVAFWIAGVLCVVAGLSFLTIGRRSFATARSPENLATA